MFLVDLYCIFEPPEMLIYWKSTLFLMNLHLRHLIAENLEESMNLVIKLQKSSRFKLVELFVNVSHSVHLASSFDKKVLYCVKVQKVAHYSVVLYFIYPFLYLFSKKIELILTEHCDEDQFYRNYIFWTFAFQKVKLLQSVLKIEGLLHDGRRLLRWKWSTLF